MFGELYESWERNELLLRDGAMARIYRRKDGNIRVQEIFSTKSGAGSKLIEEIKLRTGGHLLKASCPLSLPSVTWWPKVGFTEVRRYSSKKGNTIVEFEWRLS